jgi:outer membrane protein assembly factor BamB
MLFKVGRRPEELSVLWAAMEYRAPPLDAPLLVISTQVVALDRATGKERWRYKLDGVTRRFAIDDNRLFVFESTGTLHCLELATGRLIGRVETELMSPDNMLVDGDRLYVSASTHVVAIDFSGKILWRESVPTNASNGLCGLAVPGGNIVQPDFSRG